ncbi:MAG: AAA family ATPase [Bacteroidetes bacterium]|nr:AAA family ATPase [Bacteroidota bacterium]
METVQIKKVWEEAFSKISGAHFYKCALQVNPYSYSTYRGESTMDESEYNRKIVEKCKENKISVVGLADHGSVQNSENLRKALTEAVITVFPGFEICSSEKVQMVCLFPADTSVTKLNQILGALQGEAVKDNKKTSPSNHTTLQIAEKIFRDGGVWYAAHMEDDNGLLKLHQDGGGMVHVWQTEKLVLAGQIKGSADDLESNYKQIVLNKDINYKRINLLSLINAKDVEKPETLDDPRASCLIKMTEPSIEALKQAFLDGESRIRLNSEREQDEYHSKIKAVAFDIGFLDGIRIHFNNNLNAIIGGRGSGKSTIIECIRYCLGLKPKSKEAERNHNNIVEQNLRSGRITMLIYSHQQNKDYVISRIYGEPIRITDKEGNISHLTIDELIPGIELLGQNEILTLAEDRSNQVSLLNRFLPGKLADTAELLRQLKDNRLRLIAASEKKETAEAEVTELKKLEEQLKRFKELGIQEKLATAEKYEQEKSRIIKRIGEETDGVNEHFNVFKEATQLDLTFLSDDAIKELPNKDLFSKFKKVIEDYFKKIQPHLQELQKFNNELKSASENLNKEWSGRQQHFQEELMKIISGLPDMAGRSGKQLGDDYLKIVRKISVIQSSEKQFQQHGKVVEELKKEREKLVAELSDVIFRNFQQIESAVKKLNKNQLRGRVRITAEKGKNRERLLDFLKELPGISAKRAEWVNQPKELNVQALVSHIKQGKEKLLEEYRQYGLTDGIGETITNMGRGKIMELEEIILGDEIQIELNVSHLEQERYQPLENLSTGQKCTAILHLLLLDNKDPLIIDQPEDNLDNAFIADRIVKDLRKAKERRQFVISTHNANIPVFGDAEWIGALEALEVQASLPDENVGSIDKDSVRHKVEAILEGGKTAFEIRRLKYGF